MQIDMNDVFKGMFKVIVKFVLTIIAIVFTLYISLILLLTGSFAGFSWVLIILSILVFPSFVFPLIYVKNKKEFLFKWLIFFIAFVIIMGVDRGIYKYNKRLEINTTPNINTSEYLPFENKSKIVKLDKEVNLRLTENLPILDGAAACFPLYSAFVNATYPNTVELDNNGVFRYNNTLGGYKLLAEKEIDIFFGGYPSEEQIQKATEEGTEFEYTEIGKEAFVFFVHKNNPISSLTTEQIKGIYSGKITNWKEVGGEDEEIVAFQRNEGSGSQSMLERFMGDTSIMEAPKKQVNDMMSGIIDRVADYKNTSSAIGFSFRYYLEGIIKNPDIKMISIDGVEPTKENIREESYPITTSVYAVTYKGNDNENIEKFLYWILSDEGQQIVEETGYVRIK